jgi:adenine-specific DNA-methyltransferase
MGWWLISKYCTAIQSGYQLIWQYFGQIPIQKEMCDKKKIIVLVDKILSLKSQNPAADTTALEAEIDLMVYKLYNLTWEEVKIVDPEFAMSEEEYMLV